MNPLHPVPVVRCAIYIRSAVTDPSNDPLHALRAICEELVAANRLNGWDIQHVFCDNGHSGNNLYRPGIRALLQPLRRGSVEMVIAPDLTHISRSVPDLREFLNTVATHNAHSVSATDSLHFQMPIVALLLPVLVGLSQVKTEQGGGF